MEMLIQREPTEHETTYGKFSVNDRYYCESLEDEIRELPQLPGESDEAWVARWKVPRRTAIPAGRYRVTIDRSTRFNRMMPHVLGVAGFSGIRIHALNTAAQTEGCPGVGKERTNWAPAGSTPVPGLMHSGVAFAPLFDLMKEAFAAEEEIWLTVRNPGQVDGQR